MKRNMSMLLLVFLTLGRPDVYCGDGDTLTILHVNDTHSHLTAGGPRNTTLEGTLGGIARIATLVRRLEATSPNPWFVHAGDLSVGDIFYNAYHGVPEYRILKSLGCKAMAVGNHEWDLGPAVLESALTAAFGGSKGFPLLSANTGLDDPHVRGLRKYILPFITGRAGGSMIGLFGLTTPETNLFSNPAPARVDTPFRYAAAIVDTLRARGCSAIICLSHLGLSLDRQLASKVPGINIIVGGHDHYELRLPVAVASGGDTTWIFQAGANYHNVGVVRVLIRDCHVRLLASNLIPVDSSVAKSREVDRKVSSLVRGVESKYGPVFSNQIAASRGFFSEVADSLMQRTHGETPVGTLVTDAFRDLTGTDIAIEPGGSTSDPLYPGPVVADDCFRVIGYGFNSGDGLGYPLVRFDITGGGLVQGIEMGLADIESNDEYFLQSSGLRYTYDPSRRAGERFVSATVAGEPLGPARSYSVTANYFVKVFLDRLGVPYTDCHVFGGDTTEFMALTRYVSKRKTLTPVPARGDTARFPFNDTRLACTVRVNDLVSRMTLKEKISQMQNHAPAVPRLGIQEYNWWSEALHGVARNGIATVFPQAIGMAATWNPRLIHTEADVVSTEARAKHNEAIRRDQRRIYHPSAGKIIWG